MISWLILVISMVPAGDPALCRIDDQVVAAIRSERVTGSLAVAESETRRLLECPSEDAAHLLALRIELAKILDRVGLHTNTRPVAEVLEILRRAEADVDDDDTAGRARIALALAGYYYRAEMAEREFTNATVYALQAEQLFHELDDPVGGTDAVHRLGLIEFQKRNLEPARALFDRSLDLSRAGPDRPIFLSDYHRHIGFVDLLSDDLPTAIGHFERSLAYRDQARSRDYGLFARTTLSTALIRNGRAAEVQPYLEQALEAARKIPSPAGEMRVARAFAMMYEELNNPAEASRWLARYEELVAELEIPAAERQPSQDPAPNPPPAKPQIPK